MPPKPLTRQQTADLAASLDALLDAIRRDELSATTAMTYRLEGALTALRTALDSPSDMTTG